MRTASADPIVILGPTATGKSDLALQLARRIGGRIIGADSIQVYRGLDAGSCKPPAEARREIRHDLIDVADPSEPFSAGEFVRQARAVLDEAREYGQPVIIAGGTGLYLRALLHGIAPMPPRDEALRRRLYGRGRGEGAAALHAELSAIDPETAARVGPNDLQRVVRALEVAILTGTPLSAHVRARSFRPDRLPALKVGLTMLRDALYRRIDSRVERIFRNRIVEEVREMLGAGVPPSANALKALGYREVMAHLRGEIDLARAVDQVKRNTRRYARRQLSWFRRERNVHWFEVAECTDGGDLLEGIAEQVMGLRWNRTTR